MKTISLLAWAGIAGSGVLPLHAARQTAQTPKQPNILLLFVDDMGFKDTGFTGSDFYETPTLDSLSRLSVRFSNAYASAGNSAPSRACMITGQYTPRHGVFAVFNTHRGPQEQMRLKPYPNTNSLPLDEVTIADAMRGAGYTTAISGKWHLGSTGDYVPGKRGFDIDGEDKAPSKEMFAETNDPKNIFKEIGVIEDFITSSAQSDKPFFAYMAFHAVHEQWQARQEYIDYFSRKQPGAQHHEVVYAAMIKHVDDAVKQLLGTLREAGVADNTLIVFTSDNGGVPKTSQAPLRGFKGCLYEGGIRVPMFIYDPSGQRNVEYDIPVMNIDFYPTFLDYAGAKAPKGKILDGVSLKGLVSGAEKGLKRESLFWYFPGYLDKPCPGGRDQIFRQRPSAVIRKGDWKLTLFFEEWMLDGGRKQIDTNHCVELYNLKDDPSEQHDLATTNKAVRDELLDDLLVWIDKTQAPLPTIKTPEEMAMDLEKAKKEQGSKKNKSGKNKK